MPLEILVVTKNCQAIPPGLPVKTSPMVSVATYENPPLQSGLTSTSIFPCMYTLKYDTQQSYDLAISDLAAQTNTFSYVAPNKMVNAHGMTNDPYLSGNSGMKLPDDDMWYANIIHAPQAWDISTGQNITVAVIDSGVDFSHPDAPNRHTNSAEIPDNGVDDDGNGYIDDTSGWNFVDNTPYQVDDSGHGTHVAGIIAAKGNNAMGIVGVAYNANILALKVLDSDGSGGEDAVARAILYAVRQGARVINISLGGRGDSFIIHNALKEAVDRGVVIVDSSGNDHQNAEEFFPAKYRESITVGSVKSNGLTLSDFSNYGDVVDVVAGGGGHPNLAATHSSNVNVLSLMSSLLVTSMQGSTYVVQDSSGGHYLRKYGTSMASPAVAGIVALILSANPQLTYDQVKYILQETATDLGSTGRDSIYGYGLANAKKAVEMSLRNDLPTQFGPTGGCSIGMNKEDSILGFLVLLIFTLVILLKKDRSTKKNHNPDESGSIETTI